jgi:hypothetical protein
MIDADQVFDELTVGDAGFVSPATFFGNERGNSRSLHTAGDFPRAGCDCHFGGCRAGSVLGDSASPAQGAPSGRFATGSPAGLFSIAAGISVGPASRVDLDTSSTHLPFQSIRQLLTWRSFWVIVVAGGKAHPNLLKLPPISLGRLGRALRPCRKGQQTCHP